MTWNLLTGDVRTVLATLEPESVQTCITSPPYWGLRDYGSTDQIGLEPTPEEYVAILVSVFREVRRVLRADGTLWLNLGDSYHGGGGGNYGDSKSTRTHAEHLTNVRNRIDLDGLKPKDLVGIPWMVAEALKAPYYTGSIRDERDRIWLAAMIDAEGCMFIHRRKAGSHNGQGYYRKQDQFGAGLEISSTDRVIVERCMAITGLGSICEQTPEQNERRKQTIYRWNLRSNVCREVVREVYPYLTAKQHEARLLCGCPQSGEQARAAWEALKAIHQGGEHPDIDFPAPGLMFERGWFLRSDIIWSKKPNPMPESVTDRPTKSHEYLFLLTKSPRYFYDADAIREAHARTWDETANGDQNRWATGENTGKALGRATDPHGGLMDSLPNPAGRNRRSVWQVATQPFPGAHFATFPPKLIEPCILAGSPSKCCGECGAPWERRREDRETLGLSRADHEYASPEAAVAGAVTGGPMGQYRKHGASLGRPLPETLGWQPTCAHSDDSGHALVLDPFAGAGTTLLVAEQQGRDSIGIELNPEYAQLARDRLANWDVNRNGYLTGDPEPLPGQGSLL